MKRAQSYVFMFVPIPERWVAHASRAPAMASSPSRTSLDSLGFQAPTNTKDRFGGMPEPARETRALPNDLFWTWFVDNPRPSSC
jgi:hypothetical protein